METREFQVRIEDEESRTVSGVAVPYGETISVGGFKERFERGAFQDFDETIKLLWQHEEPIGKITRAEETDEGYKIDAIISNTTRGDEAYTLLQDGVVDAFSVGFEPIENRKEGEVIVRTKARLREVSIVSFPAYSGAVVEEVREQQEETKEVPVEESQTNEISELRSVVEDIDRRMTVMAESAPTAVVSEAPKFRSLGELVKALGEGDESAHAYYESRTWVPAGATVQGESISDDVWVSEVIRLVDMGRPTMGAFRRGTLPASGMNVEYPKVDTNSIAVDKQALEGDDLAYGLISLTSETAPVETFGGYTRLSFQTVQRSSLAYVDAALRAMAIEFAKVTNQNVVDALEAATGVGTATWDGSAAGLFGVIADASVELYTKAGLRPQFFLAAPDQYKALATLFDADDRPIVGGQAPVNNIGSANLPGLTGTVGGLPIIVDPALTAGGLYIANSEGMVSYESAGAPVRLQDDNTVNLSRDISLYGYEAVTMPMPEAIVKIS